MKYHRCRSIIECALALLAFSPVITSIITWNVDGKLTPFQYHVRAYSYIVVAVECAVILMTILSGANLKAVARRVKGWQRWMLLLTAIAAVASASSVGMHDAEVHVWLATGVWLIHFLFAYSVLTLVMEREIFVTDRFWWLLVSAALTYTTLTIIFVFTVPEPATFPWIFRMPGVVNVRHIGYFVAPAIAIAIGFHFSKSTFKFLLPSVIAILACFGSWTGSRGIFFSVAVSIAFALIFFSELRVMRRWFALVASLAIGIAVSMPLPVPAAGFGLVQPVSQFTGPNAPEFSAGRIRVWKETINGIGACPLVGHGAGMFRNFITGRIGQPFNHPHNLILEILFQWGIAGSIGLFSLIIVVWIKAIRAAMRVGVQAAPAVLVLNTLLAFSMFDGTGYYPLPIAIMVIAVAAIFSYSRQEAPLQPV